MGKLSFTIGSNDWIKISLPSHRRGEAAVRTGTAKIHVNSLSCVVDVEFQKRDLDAFFSAVKKCHQKLKGRFSLSSRNDSFLVHGEMAPHGHVRLEVNANRAYLKQRDDAQWQTVAKFSCAADNLAAMLKSREAQE